MSLRKKTSALGLGEADAVSNHQVLVKAVRVFGQVQGEIPSWLEGALIRYDSARDSTELDTKSQESGIHRFIISDGKVCLEQHVLEKSSWKKRRQSSTSITKEIFGSSEFQDPYSSKFERLMMRFEQVLINSKNNLCDSCNANICYFGDQLYIVTESSAEIQRIDPDTLKVLENITISDVVPVTAFTAHPHVLEDGSVLNIGNSTTSQNKPVYSVVHTPPGRTDEESVLKESLVLATIPCRWKFHQSYYHSFGLTGDKLIFIEQPLRVSVRQTVWSRLRGKALSTSALKWYPNEKTQIYVISLSNGAVSQITYVTDKLFVFHHINTYEENGCIIMDVIGYDSGQFIVDMAKQRLNGGTRSGNNKSKSPKLFNPTARRYVLPLTIPTDCPVGINLLEDSHTAKASLQSTNVIHCDPEYLCNHTFEQPKINSLKTGLKYTYVYGVSNSEDFTSKKESQPNMIVKLNVSTAESVSWSEDGKICVCEPVYIPSPESSREDDGILLVTLSNQDNPEEVTLLMLDAQIMAEVARVVFRTQEPISHSSHGPWVPSTRS